MYYRGAQAAIVVYDITNPSSFERAKFWVKELQRQHTTIALAGNKSDLEDQRKVSKEEAAAYAENNGLIFMEKGLVPLLSSADGVTVWCVRDCVHV